MANPGRGPTKERYGKEVAKLAFFFSTLQLTRQRDESETRYVNRDPAGQYQISFSPAEPEHQL